jgi:hypothetical protein
MMYKEKGRNHEIPVWELLLKRTCGSISGAD